MKLTGHKTEGIYRRYAIVNESDLSDGFKKLAVLHEAEQRMPHYGTNYGTVKPLRQQSALR
mgnify:CR=1 FL=1